MTAFPKVAAHGRYTVAHLSDPHLTAPTGASLRMLANKRLLGYLSWARRRRREHLSEVLETVVADLKAHAPGHVVVTGDLTHIGLPQECADAFRWLERLGSPERVSVVPGNHECYVDDDWARTVGLWSSYLRGDEGAAAVRPGSFPIVRVRGPLAVVGLNSATATAPLLATGRLGDRQLEALSGALEQTGAAGLFRLVLIHHSPLAGTHSWRKRLADARPLRTLLRDAGAELILHGHGHVERLERLETAAGDTPVIGAPSASRAGDLRAGWNRFTVSWTPDEWLIELETRRLRSATGRLEATGSHRFSLVRAA